MTDCKLSVMAEKLISAENILLFPHIGIDGDCAGCVSALAVFLRKIGKNVFALYKEELPENLKFLDRAAAYGLAEESDADAVSGLAAGEGFLQNIFVENEDIIADEVLDIAMCVDNGGFDRFPDYADKFKKAKLSLCLDHHGTSIIRGEDGSKRGIADLSHIDPAAAACGTLTFELISEIDRQWVAYGNASALPDKAIGEAIFTAITTDTGNFQYSNTDKKCHEIMAELYDWDIDFSKISVILYENERLEAVEIRSKAISRMKSLAGGKGVISYLTKEELDGLGIMPGETDSIINSLRTISGVEFAAFIKEKEAGVVRVSLRAKRDGNVAAIAEKFNGGGHIKAAGCTIYASVEEAVGMISEAIELAAAEL